MLYEGRWLDERRTVAVSFAETAAAAAAESLRRVKEPRRFTTLPVHSGSAAD